MFNPIKYQYMVTLIREEGNEAIIKLNAGALEQEIRIPRSLLPKEVKAGERFTLSFQPEEAAQKGQYESMKSLLNDLIH